MAKSSVEEIKVEMHEYIPEGVAVPNTEASTVVAVDIDNPEHANKTFYEIQKLG